MLRDINRIKDDYDVKLCFYFPFYNNSVFQKLSISSQIHSDCEKPQTSLMFTRSRGGAASSQTHKRTAGRVLKEFHNITALKVKTATPTTTDDNFFPPSFSLPAPLDQNYRCARHRTAIRMAFRLKWPLAAQTIATFPFYMQPHIMQ